MIEPSINVQKITPVLNVTSIELSFQWFEKLGWLRSFTWNDSGLIGEGPGSATENENGPAGFGGVCSGEVSLFLCVDGQGQRGSDSKDGMWMTWWLGSREEVDAVHAKAVENSMEITQPPQDEPWGVREFHLRHPDGHVFRVSCGI